MGGRTTAVFYDGRGNIDHVKTPDNRTIRFTYDSLGRVKTPVRAGIVRDAWEYSWSSAAYHAGKTDQDRLVESDDMLRELIGDWKSYLRDDDQEDFLRFFRQSTFGG